MVGDKANVCIYQRLTAALVVASVLVLSGCQSTHTYEIPLMPAPEYIDGAAFNPFTNSKALPADGKPEMLYATLRLPAGPADSARYYGSQRGQLVRLGEAHIEASENTDWDMLRDIGLVRSKGSKFTLRLGELVEFGALASTRTVVDGDPERRAADAQATARFAAAVNAQLESREVKDIFIYVHGYKVNFENPLLVAAELWHFTGYEGVFIPFAWPSREGRLAYFGDVESARYAARGFREFLAFLATETEARRIHVVGYSAGTRMVLAAMHELGLQGSVLPAGDLKSRLRLGNVILVGSDVDLGLVGNYFQDGMLAIAERFTFYESPADAALRMARFVTGQPRAGQLLELQARPDLKAFLASLPTLAVVDVKSAPFFDSGNGHSYFKDSPRVSSDLLATLRYGLTPEQRGLVRKADGVAWEFPPDYIDRLRAAVAGRQAATAPSGEPASGSP
jgi:esterase/lipase superfamily enzyme